MYRWVLLVVLVVPLAVAAERTPAPLPAEVAARSAVLPDGFHMTLFAAEPDVIQPVSFCIDARGRLVVAEAMNYGEWKPVGRDRVVILADTDHDGRADQRTVFFEGFNYITGVEVGFGGVWVVSPPCLYFVPDRDADDRPDGPPEVVFDGFGYKESRHNLVNGFTWGPDGWLYGGHGRTSPSDVGRPGTPLEKRIHCDGGVYRIHPTKRIFENVADGTTNPWGVDFDDYGQCFVSNCVNPHLFHMIPGGHYEPWRNRPSSLYAYERLPTIADHLHYPTGKPKEMRGETPEVLAMGGGHAHCGTLVYLGDQFPSEYRNSVLMCNVHGRRVNRDTLTRKGSGYTAGHAKDLMLSADPWFMGVTLRTGPDGSVYVSDWSDTGECHTYKPDLRSGRIYTIRHGNRSAKPIDLTTRSDRELAELQLHRNDYHVRHARRILQERATRPNWDATPATTRLREILASSALPPQRLRALWALHAISRLDRSTLVALLGDRSDHVRGWAVRLLGEAEALPDEATTQFRTLAAHDPSPVVRLALASALQRLPTVPRWDIATGLLNHAEDVSDANLPLMIWYGIEPLVPADPARALTLARSAAIPQVRQFVARRVLDGASDATDLDPLIAAVMASTAEVQRDLLLGAREGLRGRKSLPMPANWPAAYAVLKASPDRVIRETAVVLALVFGDAQAVADLRRLAVNPAASAEARVAAITALTEKRVPDLAPLLLDLLGDPVTRRVALRALAAYPHPSVSARILAAYPTLSTDERPDAIATLAARADTAIALLDAVGRQAVPRGDISAYAARQMHALGDAAVNARLQTVWGAVRDASPKKAEQLARLKAMLSPTALKAANPGHGRVLFAKSCQQCHKLFGEGGTIGPDLTGSNRSDLDYLLSNLLDPSAEVGRDFRMSVVKAADGRVLTGIVVERLPTRVVVQTATERVTLSADDIDAVTDSPFSIMPEGQLDPLTQEQIRDLVAYLVTKVQVPIPVEARR